MSRSWGSIMRAVKYGYKPFYLFKMDGIPVIFSEIGHTPTSGGEPIAPNGYTIHAALVVDDSPRPGAAVDDRTHLSKAFDFEARFIATAIVNDLFSRPTRITTMTADLDAAVNQIAVESTAGFDSTPIPYLYYGLSCASPGFGTVRDMFTGIDRDEYGPAKSYKAGTVVADRPRVWKARWCEVWVALIDPLGRVVQGADVFSDACIRWAGHVQRRPTKDGQTWLIKCRDQVRRLNEPLGIAASGQAVWSLDDDHAMYVDETMTIAAEIRSLGGSVFCSVVAKPFEAVDQPVPQSLIRVYIADRLYSQYLAAAPGDGTILSFGWQMETIDGPSGGMKRTWRLVAHVDTDGTIATVDQVQFKVQVVGHALGAGMRVDRVGVNEIITADSADVVVPSVLRMETQVTGAGLAVTLEEGTFSRLPTAGIVMLEKDSGADYFHYLSKTQDENDYRKVLLEIDPVQSTGQNLQTLAALELAGELVPVSAKFLWRDTGTANEIMRRSIVSSGDATNGADDTLPRGQGYDLRYIDAASFNSVFDGAFRDLSFDLAIDGGSSFEKMWGGLLKLSQRAITTRIAADGSSVDIVAVSVGSADAAPAYTITDDSVLATGGARPIRQVDEFLGPSSIYIKAHRLPVGTLPNAEAELEYNDEHLSDWSGERWELNVHGLPRRVLELPASAWSRAWFRGGENRQIVEIDLPPDFEGQAGDIVFLSVRNPMLFDYAVGAAGLTGFARILGVLFSLTTGVLTAIVQCDGVNAPGPMSPSLPISGINGGATTPTSIDMDEDYLDLLTYAKGAASSWKVLAYKPGSDAGRAEYTISTVALTGGAARLTVTAYPSAPAVTLTTAYRLTWPVEANSTTEQNRFLHTSKRVQWS